MRSPLTQPAHVKRREVASVVGDQDPQRHRRLGEDGIIVSPYEGPMVKLYGFHVPAAGFQLDTYLGIQHLVEE